MLKKISVTARALACGFVALLFVGFIYTTHVYAQAGEGEKIYSEHCSSCHDGGFFGWLSGAPKTGDLPGWEPFLKKGVDKMVASAIKGTERMDPKGDCDTCTDEQIRKAVEYIVSQTKP